MRKFVHLLFHSYLSVLIYFMLYLLTLFYVSIKGTYDVQNWNVDLNVATGIFPYNSYRGIIQLFDQTGKKLLCIVSDIDIIPKVQ